MPFLFVVSFIAFYLKLQNLGFVTKIILYAIVSISCIQYEKQPTNSIWICVVWVNSKEASSFRSLCFLYIYIYLLEGILFLHFFLNFVSYEIMFHVIIAGYRGITCVCTETNDYIMVHCNNFYNGRYTHFVKL